MNLEQVAHFTAHPQELQFQDAAALKTLAEKYPFSSVYSLLYLTALSNGKSPDLDLALKQHAYRLTDRTKLYHLLTGGQPVPEQQTNEPVVMQQTDPAEAPAASVKEEIPAEEPVAAPEPATLPVAEEVKEETLTFEQAAEEVIVFEEPEAEEIAIEWEAEKITAEASPSEGITTEALSPEHTEAFDELTEAFTREQHFEVTEPEANSEPEKSVSEQPETNPVIIQQAEEEPEQAQKPAAAAPAESKRSFTSWLHSGQASPVLPESQPKKPEVNQLIDKFIEQEPSITRAKADFYSPSRKAKESLNEDALPVSETLAKIYAAQGNYPKAIHVYHQLMLSFPEKKSLFAVQIEELKNKITP